jgi:hypothetical protein
MSVRNYDNKEAFSFYKNFDDYMAWTDMGFQRMPNNYFIKSYANNWTQPDADFVGSDDVDLLNGKLPEFIEPLILDGAIREIKNLFSLINLGGAFDKDRMVATDMPIGVFDFSLASQGLYRPQEYYCPETKKVIDPNFVKKFGKNPDVYGYIDTFKGEKKTFFVTQQQEGTREIQKMNNYIEELVKVGETREFATELAKAQFPKAKLVFRTTTKKVNLVRRSKTLKNNKVGNEKYVDLFLKIGGSALETPRSLLYRTMPSLLVAYFLDQAGIKTRILGLDAYASFESRDTRNYSRYMNSYVVKEYEDPFDFNEISILTADSRTFRWKLFRSIGVQFSENFNRDNGSGVASVIGGEEFNRMFERYKNFYIDDQKTKSGIKNQNSRLMFTTELSINKNDTDAVIMEQVKEEFFRLIDAIDIEFNGSKTALPRIKTRELARGVDITNLRNRLNGTILTTTGFDESDSKYSTTASDIQTRIALRQKLIDEVNTIYRTI